MVKLITGSCLREIFNEMITIEARIKMNLAVYQDVYQTVVNNSP